MIQRSLPRAEQQSDPLSSRPYSSVFLRHVPIPLLPLNPTTFSASPSPASFPSSPSSPPTSPPIRSPHSSPPRRTGYSALDLHPNSIFFSSPPKRKVKPTSPPQTQPKRDSCSPPVSPTLFQGFMPHNVPVVTPPPPAPSELRPHNIVVPPPPVPPARTSTAPLPPIPSNLPPPKRFAFLPLLDDTSSSHKKECENVSSPKTDTTLSPAPSPTCHDKHYPRSDSSFSEMDTCYSSDTDCSLFASDTEFSTPSLTTASLASSSPSESPRMPCTDSPPFEQDGFVLNLDTDPDVDAASSMPVPDSYFPRMPMSMSPLTSTPTLNPVSSFHSRYPHRSPQTQTHTQKPSIMAVPSPDLPAPSPLDLSQRHGLVFGSRKKLSMPIVALAETPASLPTRDREGCEYAQMRAGSEMQEHGQIQGQGERSRQLSLSRS